MAETSENIDKYGIKQLKRCAIGEGEKVKIGDDRR
jgi:hypothetical protein